MEPLLTNGLPRVLIEYSCSMCATLANANNSIEFFEEYLSRKNIFRGNPSFEGCFKLTARTSRGGGMISFERR